MLDAWFPVWPIMLLSGDVFFTDSDRETYLHLVVDQLRDAPGSGAGVVPGSSEWRSMIAALEEPMGTRELRKAERAGAESMPSLGHGLGL